MEISRLLNLNHAEQLEWLETRFESEAKAAGKDISSYINGLAWDEPLGSSITFDQSEMDDMIENPEGYDLGFRIQSIIEDLSDQRATEINAGNKLTSKERSAVKSCVKEEQIEGDGGTFRSGSTIQANMKDTVFVSFSGPSMGQGGIDYSFYRLFENAQTALKHFKHRRDIWVDY